MTRVTFIRENRFDVASKVDEGISSVGELGGGYYHQQPDVESRINHA